MVTRCPKRPYRFTASALACRQSGMSEAFAPAGGLIDIIVAALVQLGEVN